MTIVDRQPRCIAQEVHFLDDKTRGLHAQPFALEQRASSSDDDAVRRARLTVAAMAARQAPDDVVAAARDVIEALGLVDAPPVLEAVSS